MRPTRFLQAHECVPTALVRSCLKITSTFPICLVRRKPCHGDAESQRKRFFSFLRVSVAKRGNYSETNPKLRVPPLIFRRFTYSLICHSLKLLCSGNHGYFNIAFLSSRGLLTPCCWQEFSRVTQCQLLNGKALAEHRCNKSLNVHYQG